MDKEVISTKEMDLKPPEERHKFITSEEDYNLRCYAAEKYAAITTGQKSVKSYIFLGIISNFLLSDYFCERIDRLFDDVLRKVYGMKDSIVTNEFQHR